VNESTTIRTGGRPSAGAGKVKLKALIGSGDRIGKTVLPALVACIAANVLWPEMFSVRGQSAGLQAAAWVILAAGVVVWAWSVGLILIRVPRHELITSGPFALVKHPLYTGVSLLLIPALGIVLGTWLGVVLGVVMYIASRRHAPAEERALAEELGAEWDEYASSVKLPWL